MCNARSEWNLPVSTFPSAIHMLAMWRFHLACRTRETGMRAAPGVWGTPKERGLMLLVRWIMAPATGRLAITRLLSNSLFIVSSRDSAFLNMCMACRKCKPLYSTPLPHHCCILLLPFHGLASPSISTRILGRLETSLLCSKRQYAHTLKGVADYATVTAGAAWG